MRRRWINVEDRVPPVGEIVEVKGNYTLSPFPWAWFTKAKLWDSTQWRGTVAITHWRPLKFARGPKGMGKAETASRNKNASGAADSGESRDGGTRAVSFSDRAQFLSVGAR